MVTSEFFRQLCLFFRADTTDDFGTEMRSPLAENEPHASCSGIDQNGFPFLHDMSPSEQIHNGHPFEHHRGCGLIFNPIRQGNKFISLDRPALTVSSQVHRVGNPLSRNQSFHPISDFFNHSRTLHTQDLWKFQRVKPASLIDVDKIQSHRRMSDQDFSGTWRIDLGVF